LVELVLDPPREHRLVFPGNVEHQLDEGAIISPTKLIIWLDLP